MALISELVGGLALVEGRPETSVALIARTLREDGLLSQGARGRNAPHATATDCSNLLIGTHGGADTAKDAPTIVRRYRALKMTRRPLITDVPVAYNVTAAEGENPFHDLFKVTMTFGEVLDNIIQGFIDQRIDYFVRNHALQYISTQWIDSNLPKKGNDPEPFKSKIGDIIETSLRNNVDFSVSLRSPYPSVLVTLNRQEGGEKRNLVDVRFAVDMDLLMSKTIDMSHLNRVRDDRATIHYPVFNALAALMRGTADRA